MTDTIYALATAVGRSAIAIVRVSGPSSTPALRALTRASLPAVRKASVRKLFGLDGEPLDEALAIRWAAPNSFTGEDVVELHLHGGSAVVDSVLEALEAAGLRPAAPGEFARRAFENGRLSLAEAEGVADLIDAESRAQREQALQQLGGALDRRYASWRQTLVQCLAQVEATIDFPDEDLPSEVFSSMLSALSGLRSEWIAALGEDHGRQIREGYRIAIVGLPNAGKSSLFNALVERPAAIVAPYEGTTRDVIEAPVILSGYRVILADMAGLRMTTDPIEAEGVRRATVWAQGADLRLWLQDLTRPGYADTTAALMKDGDWVIGTKHDLAERPCAPVYDFPAGWWTRMNVNNAEDVSILRAKLSSHLAESLAGRAFPATTRRRHREALQLGLSALTRALEGAGAGAEFVGEDLRLAARSLEQVTGRIDAEAVLDEVFSSFCIGK